jgi:D-glycero-alpha-D-manno-heptose-7-phosphate kinase
VIITRTPFRISLGGGGTDLPSYYRENGHGFLIAAAITKYVYIAVNENFNGSYFLRYSKVEETNDMSDIKHPLLRECIRLTETPNNVEVTSIADVPSGTGLGSSGSFAVGALKALHQYSHRTYSAESLAEQACHIELNVLGEPIGKQDQYIAAVGGISSFTFRDDETVVVERLDLDRSIRNRLEDNLLLFYTGVRRSASEALASENDGSNKIANDNNLTDTRAIGYETREILAKGDMSAFGRILTNQWKLKFHRQPTHLHNEIDGWIDSGISAGALGGKLVGAGGGGFLLFYADRKDDLRKAMNEIGLTEVGFGIDYEGSALSVSK